ncbi:MAG: FtsK/SpoIIIE domain-containing protein [Pseudonocardiaceae bacterium]
MTARRMRRHARRMHRYGLQPVMVINSTDQLPDTIVVLIFWWAWRYRSELAPLFLATATAFLAWMLHLTHPQWWPAILAVAVLAGCGLAVTGHRFGLPASIDCLYAAVVVTATGGWFAAATAMGPLAGPLPHLWVIGGLSLAVPWWAHRRRRARVRVERKLEAWPEIARAVGLAGSQVMSAVVDVWGWRARFRLARGQTIDEVRARLSAIESGLGIFRGAARVYPTPDDLANRFELRVLDTDPHAGAIGWPGPSVTSITEPIEFGPFEDAIPARVLFLRRHGLLGGATGSGKSGGLNVLMGNLSACRDVVIWAIDLKNGMELQPWASCIDRLATNPAQARALLHDAVAILEARAAMLAATGQRAWQPTPEMPALIIVIDEYAELSDNASDAAAYTDSLARRGRAVAVTLVAATQRPTQKAMGQGAVRSQMDIRICFRVRERKDVDLILGQGMLSAGWHAHTLNAPGKFLMSAPEHDTPRRARAYLLTDDMVGLTASQHAEMRPSLDEISRQAVEDTRPADTPRPPHSLSNGHHGTIHPGHDNNNADGAPMGILWAALSLAPDEGVSVPELMNATRMSRPWVYQRLRELADRGQVTQVSRGRWRAVIEHPQ